MESRSQPNHTSRKLVWSGLVVSVLPALLLLLSGVMKLAKPPAVLQGFAHYGYPETLIVTLGILELACTVLYLIPRTSFLGAILLTAYLGGATATNVRVGDPSLVAPVVLGVMVWTGLFLRDERLRALVPLRS